VSKIRVASPFLSQVGLSNAILLAQHNEVVALDINQDKFNYTEWRRTGLPDLSIEQIAAQADQLALQLSL